MERNLTKALTPELEAQFRINLEGFLPDLLDATGEGDERWLEYDDVYDFAADRAGDTFPNLSSDVVRALAHRVTVYYCGEKEPDTDADAVDSADFEEEWT